MKTTITFDKTLSKYILFAFGKEIDAEGFIIVSKSPSERVLSPEGGNVALEEFAGITQGSELFIKSDLPSLIDFSKRLG